MRPMDNGSLRCTQASSSATGLPSVLRYSTIRSFSILTGMRPSLSYASKAATYHAFRKNTLSAARVDGCSRCGGLRCAETPGHVLDDVPNSALCMIGRERARDVGAAGEPALQPLELRAVFGAEFLAEFKVALDPGGVRIIGNAGNAPADCDALGCQGTYAHIQG